MNKTAQKFWLPMIQVGICLAPALTLIGTITIPSLQATADQPQGSIPQTTSLPSLPTLTDTQIETIATQTTVVIGQGLQKGDIEARQEFRPGSGFIVAKTGKTYYVATNLHVVGGEGTIYGVRTYDGEVYFADDQEPQQFPTTKIYRFGEEKADGTIQGFDLAIIKLQSDKDYPIASVPLSRVLASLQNPAAPLVTKGEKTFVSGWPDPDDQAPRREFRFSTGVITEVVPPTTDGGYGLFYTSVTRRGMSGGPVFNDKGEVVGIHGRAGSVVNPTANLGIIVSNLTQEAVRKAQLAIFKLPGYAPPEPITLTQKAVPPTAKVIPDIFKDFTRDFKSAALRECPSGGSGWIDLGGKDDQCPSR